MKLRLNAIVVPIILAQTAAAGAQDIQHDKPTPWLLQFDLPSDPTQRDIYEFAWKSFIALNWPHKDVGQRGEPDPAGTLAPIDAVQHPSKQSPGPVVWETYFLPNDVFIEPSEWPYRFDPSLPRQGDLTVLHTRTTDYSEFAEGINQPYTQANYPTGPVVDQNGNYLRYQVTMSQSYAAYVAHFAYYNADQQATAVSAFINYVKKHRQPPPAPQPGQPAQFFQPVPDGTEAFLKDEFHLKPFALQGMIETKAAWKVLTRDDVPERYYRRRVLLKHGDQTSKPVLVGLVGLHIHRVTPFGHLPSTFEHIDNVELKAGGPLPLPPHPSLNPGVDSAAPPPYPNGYTVNGKGGISGVIPKPIRDDEPIPPPSKRPVVNVSRAYEIPDDVQAVNAEYRERLKDSVWSYYQLIGTQNKNLNKPPLLPNRHLGPGIIGAQTSNTRNLINTTLESYTQRGFSCARCHLNAWPHGVTLPLPPFEQNYAKLHVMSFLLLNAKRTPGSR